MQYFGRFLAKPGTFYHFHKNLSYQNWSFLDYFFDRKNFIQIFLEFKKRTYIEFHAIFKSEIFRVEGSNEISRNFTKLRFWWCENGLLMSITFMLYAELHKFTWLKSDDDECRFSKLNLSQNIHFLIWKYPYFGTWLMHRLQIASNIIKNCFLKL